MTINVERGVVLLDKLARTEAVATDLDGTLTKDRRSFIIPLETVSSIRLLRNNGVKVIIVSANGYPILSGLARYIGFDAIVAENGCILAYEKPGSGGRDYVVKEETSLNIRGLARSIAEKLSSQIRESWQNDYRKFDFALVTKDRSPPSGDLLDKIRKLVDELGFSRKVRVSSSGYAVHLTPFECSKQASLRKLLDILGIPVDNVVGIGDSEMDVEFVSKAGVAVAVSNADEQLKKVADIITEKESGYGFAELAELIVESKRLLKDK